MISYFIVARCMFTINFSSKLKSQFKVIFGNDSFPLFCRTLQTVSSLMDGGIPALTVTLFLQKSFPSLLASAWFVVRYFPFVKQTVLVATKSPIFFFMFGFEYFQYDIKFDISE